jgi:hypothetical protein
MLNPVVGEVTLGFKRLINMEILGRRTVIKKGINAKI